MIVLENANCDLCKASESEKLFLVTDPFSAAGEKYNLVRCASCGLIYVNPRPTAETIGLCYPSKYYEVHVSHSSKEQTRLVEVERRRLHDIGRFSRTGSILDIGCGNGRFLSVAKESGWRTLGIEISPKMADFARREYGLEVLETSFLEAKLPSAEFDVVTMWGVLEHLHHPKAAVMEVHRLLRPGGLFVALVPNIDSTQFRLFGPQWPLLDVPRHLYHFSPQTLRRMVGEAGFQPVWTRFYAREHDLGNLIQSLEIVFLGRQKHLNQAASPVRSKWTTGRIAMGVARRLSCVIARTMALRQHSAAMEMYCIKT